MSKSTFQTAVARFLEYMQHGKNRSARTCEVYELALTRLDEYMGDRDPLTATAQELALFTGKWLYNLGISAIGRRPYVAAVRGFYKWAHSAGHVARDPARSMDYPKIAKVLPSVMTLATAERLMYAPDLSTFQGLRDAAILSVLMGTGMRVSGLVGINQEDLHADVIDKRPRLFALVREKGGVEQMKLLPAETDLYVRMYLEHPDLVAMDRTITDGPHKGQNVLFVSMGNHSLPADQYVGEKRRLSRLGVLKMIKAYGTKAGLPEVQLHPHAIRHMFGTQLMESDVDIRIAQSALGHADIKSTAIYSHLAQVKKSREIDRANPMAKMTTPISQFLERLKPKA